MSILQHGARVGAATFVVGFSLAWPQVAGIASADKPDQDSASVSAGPAKSGTSTRPPRSNAARPSNSAPAAGSARSQAAATAAAPAHSTAAARSAPTATQSRRVIAGRATEAAVADAVLSAIGIARPDPASASGTTTASAAVATVAVTTTPKVAASTASAAVPVNADKVSTLTVPRANDVLSTITDFFSGLVGSVQSLVEGVGLLVRRFLFNQAPTLLPVQTSGQTNGQPNQQNWSTITGTVNAVDPEDDSISYSVVQPEHGTVTIDSNGNYTYVPKPGFTGADTFTVKATDTGLHINLLDLGRAPSTDTIVSVGQVVGDPRLGYSFVFGDGGRYWSSAARAALETTAADLSSYFIVTNPVIITYSVTGQRTLTGTTLASAGSDLVKTIPGFYDTVVQQKIQDGTDANGTAPDGQIDWNFGYSWALGDSVAGNQYDFQSTAMHELLHSFGFLSVVDSAGNNTGTNWTTFDKYVVAKTSSGTAFPIDPNTYGWITAYNTNLTGGAGGSNPGAGGLYFGGPNAEAAYGGHPVPLYTPKPWEPGSSMSHLDDATFTGLNAQLMNAVSDTGLGIRTLSGIEIGILKDLGYNVANTPQTLAIFVIGFAFIRRRRRTAELAAV